MTRFATISALTTSAILLAGTAMAQQSGVEVPSDAQIQSSTVIPDTIDMPKIEPGTQAVEVESAGEGMPTLEDATAKAPTQGVGDNAATEAVHEMIEDGEVIEAEPVESWFGCPPDAENLPENCEKTAETPVDEPLPSEDGIGDTATVESGDDGSSVRPPSGSNEASNNLVTPADRPVPGGANEPALMSVTGMTDKADPDRAQELENEPQTVLTEKGGQIDLEKDARVVPETATVLK